VLGVTGVARGGSGRHFCGVAAIETEKGPLALVFETRFILYVDFDAHGVAALELSCLIDRAFALRATDFENEHGFVWPRAGFLESLIRLGIHENVVEHVMVHGHGWVVAHVEAGGEVDPFAVVGGEMQLAVGGVGGLVGARRRGTRAERADNREGDYAGQDEFFGGHGEGSFAQEGAEGKTAGCSERAIGCILYGERVVGSMMTKKRERVKQYKSKRVADPFAAQGKLKFGHYTSGAERLGLGFVVEGLTPEGVSYRARMTSG
jgi:hypothetical protein